VSAIVVINSEVRSLQSTNSAISAAAEGRAGACAEDPAFGGVAGEMKIQIASLLHNV
jgi:hypothetical protein